MIIRRLFAIALAVALACTSARAAFNSPSPPMLGYLSGLTLANNSTTAIDTASGTAVSDDGTFLMSLNATLTKTLSAWAAGSGNGGLDTGTAAANTWYHEFLVYNPTTRVTDEIFSLSPTAPTLPSGYTKKRRVGSVLTTSTATNFTPFQQNGDDFTLKTPVQNASNIAVTTTITNLTVTTPLGIKTRAKMRAVFGSASGASFTLVFSFDESTTASNSPAGNVSGTSVSGAPYQAASDLNVYTNTSSQVRTVCDTANCQLFLVTSGWTDTRGK